MRTLADKIIQRVRGYGRGQRVFTPKDFLHLGSRASVDQTLSRLVKHGLLRRIARGLYDFPRVSSVLKRHVPPSSDAVAAAVARKNAAHLMPDGIVAAHNLGLTNAVPAKMIYVTDGTSRTLKVGNRTIQMKHASKFLLPWFGRQGAPVVQALDWLGANVAAQTKIIDALRKRLPDSVKQDLADGIGSMPAWMRLVVRKIILSGSATAW